MILECKELTKWYGDTAAVAELTLNLSEGKIYGFLGENGSGKTTWMKMVAGLTKPSQRRYNMLSATERFCAKILRCISAGRGATAGGNCI